MRGVKESQKILEFLKNIFEDFKYTVTKKIFKTKKV